MESSGTGRAAWQVCGCAAVVLAITVAFGVQATRAIDRCTCEDVASVAIDARADAFHRGDVDAVRADPACAHPGELTAAPAAARRGEVTRPAR